MCVMAAHDRAQHLFPVSQPSKDVLRSILHWSEALSHSDEPTLFGHHEQEIDYLKCHDVMCYVLCHGHFRPVCYCTIMEPTQTDIKIGPQSRVLPKQNPKQCGIGLVAHWQATRKLQMEVGKVESRNTLWQHTRKTLSPVRSWETDHIPPEPLHLGKAVRRRLLILCTCAIVALGKAYEGEMSSEINWLLLKAGKEGNRAHEFRELWGGKRQWLLGPKQ